MEPYIEGVSDEFVAALLAEVQERIPNVEQQLRRLYQMEETFSRRLAQN